MNGPGNIPSYTQYLKPFSEVAKNAGASYSIGLHHVTIPPENYKLRHSFLYTIYSALDYFEFAKEGLKDLELHYKKKTIVERLVTSFTNLSPLISSPDEQKERVISVKLIKNKIKEFMKSKADNIDMEKEENIKDAYVFVSQGKSIAYEKYIENEIITQEEKLELLESGKQQRTTNAFKEKCIEGLLVLYDEDTKNDHTDDKINLYKKLLEISETENMKRQPELKKSYYEQLIALYNNKKDQINADEYRELLENLTPPKKVRVQPDVSSLAPVSDESWEALKTNLSNAHKENPDLIKSINYFLDLCMQMDEAKTDEKGTQAIRKRASLVVNYLIALSEPEFKEIGPRLGRAWKHILSSGATMTALDNLEEYIAKNPLSSS